MESKKYKQLLNIIKRRRLTDIENKLMVASAEGEEGAIKGWGGERYKLLGVR